VLSIITINKDNAQGLKRTISSVRAQEAADFEYLVVDGASVDGSIEIIKSFEACIDWWVSESDSGIYNAMNKAIAQASGDYCLFLNSGDCLTKSNIVSLINRAAVGDVDVLYSDALMTEGRRALISRYPRRITLGYLLINSLNHQNSVIRRAALLRQGSYREDFKIAADWFFFLKATAEGQISYRYFPTPIARYWNDGISASKEGSALNERERSQGIREIFAGLLPAAEELRQYQNSVYGSIIRHYGESKILDLLLRVYRLFARGLSCFSKA
jgi:glycosyltransferase involved in cell wall biosynthesis